MRFLPLSSQSINEPDTPSVPVTVVKEQPTRTERLLREEIERHTEIRKRLEEGLLELMGHSCTAICADCGDSLEALCRKCIDSYNEEKEY